MQANVAPAIPREFRAAWVATVANIDWPSKKGLSADVQQAEIVAMVKQAKDIGLNALLVQVRPSADAIYPSKLEPWTEFLSGEQGKAPQWSDPKSAKLPFDPLQSWVDECRRAGIELHAWFNPYRAGHTSAKSAVSSQHISKTKPHTVKAYGGFLWLDPGEPEAAQHTLDVVLDVVNRYDIAGVHIDDYFYPYPISQVQKSSTGVGTVSVKIDFPDEPSWQAYSRSGGSLQRADWRRSGVNNLIERIQTGIHERKPWLRFGISPFGLGKPSMRPPGIVGFSQYDDLYADVELWLQNGWLDYLVPQLYWPIAQKPQAFAVLLDYWATQNTARKQVWAGLYTSQINDSARSWQPREVNDQIAITRERAKSNGLLAGHVHFSMVALMQNRKGIAGDMRRAYAEPAMAPSLPSQGVDDRAVGRVALVKSNGLFVAARVVDAPVANAWQYALWQRSDGQWRLSLHLATGAETLLALNANTDAIEVSMIDTRGREGARTPWRPLAAAALP